MFSSSTERGGSAGPDGRFLALVADFFSGLMERQPVLATFLGIHERDDRLADTSRDGKEAEIAAGRRFLSELESLEPDDLSDEVRFERELAIHLARRSLFDHEVHRVWERRASAVDEIGDGLFSVLARDFAPLAERLDSMTGRLEAAPRVIDENRRRLGDRPVRLWNELELRSASEVHTLVDAILRAGRVALSAESRELARLERAATVARAAVSEYEGWLREVIGRAGGDFALGRDRYDELVALRAFDGLTTDAILAIGEEQLALNKQ
ncbi:MAG: DUF885 domain-containing protein, partial [Chloroflexota bacterium]|nr:DUF885 domain-containing protein [Chloroflexota bacterium]